MLTIQIRSDDQGCSPHLPVYDSVVKSFDHINIINNVTVDDGLAAGTSLSLTDCIPRLKALSFAQRYYRATQ